MTTLKIDAAVTRGSALLVHARFRGALRTVCGYRVYAVLTEPIPAYRTACPRCAAFLAGLP